MLIDGEHFFMDSDTKLNKVAPEGWKEGKSHGSTVDFLLYLRIKYYVDALSDFR